jgi:transcriptional regulator with AAA-type ATPase domain
LIESELFGREKGASRRSRGRSPFELADHSTLFSTSGDLPPDVQIKLLRVLEERQVERWAVRDRSASTRASSPPRIATSSSGSPTARFAKISLPAERVPDPRSVRCATAATT